MAKTLTRKPASFFRPDPHQVRKVFEEADLRALGRSIKQIGQIHPIICRSDGLIRDGEKRWRGGCLEGVQEFDCIVSDSELTPSAVVELQLVSSLLRGGLNDYELALGFLEWTKQNVGATAKQLAERVEKDPATVSRYLSLWKCGEATVKAAEARKLNVSQWAAISKADNPDQEAQLLQLALAGANRDVLEAQGRKKRNGNGDKPQEKVNRITCPLPSGITVVISGSELTLEAAYEALTTALKAMKKAIDEGLDGKVFSDVCKKKAKTSA